METYAFRMHKDVDDYLFSSSLPEYLRLILITLMFFICRWIGNSA